MKMNQYQNENDLLRGGFGCIYMLPVFGLR